MRNSYGWVGTAVGLFGVSKLFNAGKVGSATLLTLILAAGPVPAFLVIAFLIVIFVKSLPYLLAIAGLLIVVSLLVKAFSLPKWCRLQNKWYKLTADGKFVQIPDSKVAKYTLEQQREMQRRFFGKMGLAQGDQF